MGTLRGTRRNRKKAVKSRGSPPKRVHPAVPKLAAALKAYRQVVKRQAATSEVLRVISSSPSDLEPVFEAVLSRAIDLCESDVAVLWRFDGSHLKVAAHKNASPAGLAYLQEHPLVLGAYNPTPRAALERRIVHEVDVFANPEYRPLIPRGAAKDSRKSSTQIAVPLLGKNELLGVITIWRLEKRAFTETQVDLLKTFADQAAIAIANVRLFNETKEALEQQTAISDILRVISSSPTDLAPVFDSILRNATQLCAAHFALLGLYDGQKYRTVAQCGAKPEFAKWLFERGAFALVAGGPLERMVRERQPVHIPDLKASAAYQEGRPMTVPMVELGGVRTYLAVPLIKAGRVIGGLTIYRPDVRPFTEKQIALVSMFANQAVIAIENVRLFNETKEALDHQQASAEILRIVAGSVERADPAFEAITAAGMRLIPGSRVALMLVHDGKLDYASHSGVSAERRAAMARFFPMPIDAGSIAGATVLGKRTIHIPDFEAVSSQYARSREVAKTSGYRAMLSVPLMQGSEAIGVIAVSRETIGPFSDKQIRLVESFADQAVIAIQNARLFNETKEALEQQTAISEVLRVISSSPTDVKPVLDAVAVRAAKICEASDARIWLVEGDSVRHVAGFGDVPMPIKLGDALPLDQSTVSGRAILDRAPVHVEDAAKLSRDEYSITREMQERSGFRTILAVPLMREQRALGAIMLRRMDVRPFTDKQIALLKTFADQAAIAIENVRLFNETKEALDQQTSTAEVLKTISRSTFNLEAVLQTLLDNATRLSGAERAAMLRPDADGNYVPTVTFNYPPDSPLIARMRERPIRTGRDSINGRVLLEKRPIHVPDVLADPEYGRQDLVGVGRFRTVLSVPMLRDGEAIGLITLTKGAEVDPFTEKQMEVVTTFADQAVIAIENVRLFKEIEEKSAQLEVANKHKSDFLANMSHELRTPLNAIIGFSEALIDRMFGEVNEKQAEYLKDIHESGRHLLSLINDILDLSKIEAGRMELELSTFHLPSALSNAMTLIRERAQRYSITLNLDVDERLGEMSADERKFKQIMLNLLSNAVKFTPDGGRVDVSAKKYDGRIEVAVHDTGIGIAPEDQAAVFEEFKQVGRDQMRKAEGTGLGLALTRRFVELHGGAIRLESTPGKGSTFTVSLPLRQ